MLRKNLSLQTVIVLVVAVFATVLPADENLPTNSSVANSSVADAIDIHIDARLEKEKVVPARPADDATLVRRLTLDLSGRIPTRDESRTYVESNDPDKRQKLIEKLIASPDYVRHSAVEFDYLLQGYSEKTASVHDYLLTAFGENRPWDRMFQDLMGESPDKLTAGNFVLGRLNDQDALVRDVSSIFLGMNIECARCHDHPYVDSISQEYYFGTRSFFGRCYSFQGQLHERQYGVVRFRPLDGEERESRLVFLTGRIVAETLPPAEELQQKIDEENKRIDELNKKFKEEKQFPPRPAFSRKSKFVEAALAADARQRMAASIVNRLWLRFFGRGLVMPVDQMHAENPASHPALLDWLARDLIDNGFDLRRITRGMVSSRTYSRSSLWTAKQSPQKDLFAVATLRPLSPIQYGRSLQLVNELPTWPGQQTSEQHVNSVERLESQAKALYEKHLQPLKPGDQVGITEVLRFSNDEELLNALGKKLVTTLEKIGDRKQQITAACWAIYARPPTAQETSVIAALLEEQLRDDPESVKLARKQRAEIESAKTRIAAIEQQIEQIELPAQQQARDKILERTADYLAAVAELAKNNGSSDFKVVAARHDLDADVLTRWSKLSPANTALVSKMELLQDKMQSINGNRQLLGWGSDATPWLGVNSRAEPANAGFVVPPHSLAVHPSPEKKISIGWQSPIAGRVRVSFRVADGHPSGGNGVDWSLVYRQPTGESRLEEGYVKVGGAFPESDDSKVVDELNVQPGEIISLVIAAHDRQHACDTTICNFSIAEIDGQGRTWKASEQLQNRIHQGNPLADELGHPAVWHFCTVRDTNNKKTSPIVVPSSLLGRWIDMLHGQDKPPELRRLAVNVQQLLLSESPSIGGIDKKLRDDLRSPVGPLFSGLKLPAPPLDEKALTETARLTAELNIVRPIAAKPLPPLPPGIEQRHQASLRRMVWAMLMSSEFRFNH